jgi:tetratricopeptide (TPR) repeat protein
MFSKPVVWLLGSLVFSIVVRVSGQAPAAKPAADQPPAPALRKLTGADAKRAEELNKAIDAALKSDRWDEAIAKAEELLGLRAKVQGPKHFETVSAEWHLNKLRRVAPMPKEDRTAYLSAIAMNEQAAKLNDQGRYAAAQPLFEKALEIRRRLLTDEHPDTTTS